MLCCVPSCFSHVWLFATLWTVAHQTPLSMGFSREEYWSRRHALPQGIFPIQESNPQLLCLLYRQASSLALVLPGLNMSPQIYVYLEPVDMTLLKNRVFADIIKLNPTGLGWGWENKFSVISVPIRREKVGPGENTIWRPCRPSLGWCVYKPKNAKNCKPTPEDRKKQEGFFPRAFRGGMTLPTP